MTDQVTLTSSTQAPAPAPVPSDQAPKLFILMNAGSGHQDKDELRSEIERILEAAGRPYQITPITDPAKLDSLARQALQQAQQCDGVVVVAGGDGSINAVAQVMAGSGCRFGILPQGTFNYFSRTHGIPVDLAQGLDILLHAEAQMVQVGMVNDKLFLVNASLGLYPQLLEERESFKQRFGRSRLVAFCAGVYTLLRQHRQLHLSISDAQGQRTLVTPTLFVGNNPLQFQQLGIPLVEQVADDHLAAIILKPVSTLHMFGLMLRGMFGQLGEADQLSSFSFTELVVDSVRKPSRRIKVATDGEIVWLQTPLQFRVVPDALLLIKPAHSDSSEALS